MGGWWISVGGASSKPSAHPTRGPQLLRAFRRPIQAQRPQKRCGQTRPSCTADSCARMAGTWLAHSSDAALDLHNTVHEGVLHDAVHEGGLRLNGHDAWWPSRSRAWAVPHTQFHCSTLHINLHLMLLYGTMASKRRPGPQRAHTRNARRHNPKRTRVVVATDAALRSQYSLITIVHTTLGVRA
jgi:hypothetical protein